MRDRRDIAPLLGPYFPSILASATSEDWHGFLNAYTGLSVGIDAPNSMAFDMWRKALASMGIPVWGLTAEQEQEIAARGAKLIELEAQRVATLPQTLAALAIQAPNISAADLLK
jgi:hypothetical protein